MELYFFGLKKNAILSQLVLERDVFCGKKYRFLSVMPYFNRIKNL